jgi:fibronectin type 3 domain-containing protein
MYSIYRGTTSSGESFLVSAGNVLTYSDTSVINGQTYFYRVTAVNGAGEGALSNERSATPEAPTTAPGPPSNVRATASDGRIALSWSVPTDDGGQAITGYMVYRGTSRTSLAPLGSISGTAYSDATIVNGVTYYYQVSALNPAEGDRSAVVSAVFIIPPSPPPDLMATGGNGSSTLSWSSPARDGGSGVTSYNVYRGVNATSLALYRSTGDRSFTDMDVVGGVEYAYMVRAVNGAGESDASSTAFASALQVLSTPSVPQNVTAVPLRGNVSLSWGLPASDGGSPVTGYRIYRAEDPVALVPIANTTGLWYNDTTTVRGMTYHYAITALNSLGEGARSGEVNITVPLASVPSQPRDLVIWVDEGTVILSWDMPTLSGGSTIEGFIVYRGTSPEDLSVISMVNGSTFRDVRCNAGVTYYYAILAVNEAGWGPSTPIAIAYLPRSSEISSPLDLMVISGLTIGGVGGIYYLLRRGKRPQD